MKHTIGLYIWSGSEKYERMQIQFMLNAIKWSQPTLKKLTRYQAKLAQLFSEGVYDHLKALDLIYYAVDFQRKITPDVRKPRLYTCWNVTRKIVHDMEKDFFKLPPATLRHFWDLEQELENKVFENWWELHKKGLTNTARGEYNLYGRASTV